MRIHVVISLMMPALFSGALLCPLLAAPSARAADGDRFAVLPTLSSGGVTGLANDLTSSLRRTLQERSLVTVPGKAVDDAVVLALECQAGRGRACAFDVGKTTDATKVVATELWFFPPSGTYEVSIAIADLRAQTFPTEWVKIKADSEEAVVRQTRVKMLELLLPGSLNGKLNIETELVGAQIIVDGVAVGLTPMLGPPSVTAGRHELQVRYANAEPWSGTVTVEPEGTTNLRWCLKNNAVVDDCAAAAVADPGPSPMLVGGAIGAGVGVVGLAVGALSQLGSSAAQEAYAQDAGRDDYESAQNLKTLAVIGFGAGGVLVVAGGAAAAAALVME